MPSPGKTGTFVFALSVILLVTLIAPAPLEAQKRTRRAADVNKAFIEGSPLDIDKLILMATAKDAKGKLRVPADTVKEAIRNRKLTFEATDENIERLRAAGVADDVLAVVREISPPPPEPPPPPKPTNGVLAIACAPKECNVQVDGGLAEPTKAGVLRKTVAIGKHNVDFSRAGYGSERRAVEMVADGVRLNVNLKPDEATKRALGYQLFDRMLQALGDENAEVNARGSWTVQRGGLPQEWTFAMRSVGRQTTMTVLTPGGAYELSCQGETCQPKKPTQIKGKELKGADAQQVDNLLRVFRRYNIVHIAQDFRARRASNLQASTESDVPGADGNYQLHVEGSGEVYELSLNARLFPTTMSYASKLSAGPTLKISYTDYTDVGKFHYPKNTQISVPDPKVGLIQIRFDNFPASLK